MTNALRGNRLPILCYHGFSVSDEHRFRPALFITPAVFERRLRWLKDRGFHVIPLAEAVDRLSSGQVDQRHLVITIDDGFCSVGTIGWPLLKRYGFPATLYVTTYYSERQNPVFRLAVQYMVWRATQPSMRFDDLCPDVGATGPVWLRSAAGELAIWSLIEWAENALSEEERVRLAAEVAQRLGADYDELLRSRRLGLLSPSEIATLSRDGLDIQLHTHRHRLPMAPAEIVREVNDNRAVLEPMVGKRLCHLCYPSGVWSKDQWQTLRSLEIRSATTCISGFNSMATPRLALNRLLDSESKSQIDFEAELSGFKLAVRRLLRREVVATGPY